MLTERLPPQAAVTNRVEAAGKEQALNYRLGDGELGLRIHLLHVGVVDRRAR